MPRTGCLFAKRLALSTNKADLNVSPPLVVCRNLLESNLQVAANTLWVFRGTLENLLSLQKPPFFSASLNRLFSWHDSCPLSLRYPRVHGSVSADPPSFAACPLFPPATTVLRRGSCSDVRAVSNLCRPSPAARQKVLTSHSPQECPLPYTSWTGGPSLTSPAPLILVRAPTRAGSCPRWRTLSSAKREKESAFRRTHQKLL